MKKKFNFHVPPGSSLSLAVALAGSIFASTSGHAMSVAGSLAPEDFSKLGTAWNPGANTARFGGDPAPGGATWSIMGGGKFDASGFDPDHAGGPTVPITSLGVAGWTLADYKTMIDKVFDIWSSVALITNLGEVADGGVDAGAPEAAGGHLGDIRVAAWDDRTPGVLAHAYQPGTQALFGPGGTIAGDIHFDTSWIWSDDPTDGPDADFDLFTVALHEMGHALGLGHSAVVGSVMEPFYAGARRTLGPDDIAGIQAIYGVRPVVPPGVPDAGSMAFLMSFSFGALTLIRRRVR